MKLQTFKTAKTIIEKIEVLQLHLDSLKSFVRSSDNGTISVGSEMFKFDIQVRDVKSQIQTKVTSIIAEIDALKAQFEAL